MLLRIFYYLMLTTNCELGKGHLYSTSCHKEICLHFSGRDSIEINTGSFVHLLFSIGRGVRYLMADIHLETLVR